MRIVGCNNNQRMSFANGAGPAPASIGASAQNMNTLANSNNNNNGDSATISRKFSPLARTLKKNTFRAKEMMMARFGKHDRTTDEMFDDYVIQIQRQHQVAARFSKELKTYVACVKALANASKMLNNVVRDEAFEDAWHGAAEHVATSHASESLWNDYCDTLNAALLPTTQLYLDQFADIQARIAKRNRKLVDYDGARHELVAVETSKKRDEQKVAKAEEFLTRTKFAFEEINGELHRHLPRVRDSRVLFYAKTIHDLAEMELKFHSRLADNQHQSLPVLNKLVEEAEAGQYKLVWKPEAVRAQQRTATFQNNFHKRQQQSYPPAGGAVTTTITTTSIVGPSGTMLIEQSDLQMSAPPTVAGSSSSSVADRNGDNNPYAHEFDDDDQAEPDHDDHRLAARNSNYKISESEKNQINSDDDDVDDDEIDSDDSDAEKKRREQQKKRQSSSSSASRRKSGGIAGAAMHMRSAIMAKANGLLNNNSSHANNNSKRDSGLDDEHEPIPGISSSSGASASLFDGGGADGGAVDAVDAGVEFKSIRHLDDDGVPTRDIKPNNNNIKPVSTYNRNSSSSGGPLTRPPLPPAPSAHLRQLQSSGCSSSSSSVQPTTNFANDVDVASLNNMKNGNDDAAPTLENACDNGNNNFETRNDNVSRVTLRQSNAANLPDATATKPTDPNNTVSTDTTDGGLSALGNGSSIAGDQLHAILKNRKLLYRARSTHTYKGEDVDELSFNAGEIIYVVEYENPDDQDIGWQMGIRAATGDRGVFPENFTRVLMGSEQM